MPSRAEIRVRVEQVLRGIVIGVLAVMLWKSLHGQIDSGGRAVRARGIAGATLSNWSLFPKAPGRMHVQLDSVPSKIERAWLGALAGAGSSVTWSGDLPALMIDAQPVSSPTGGTKVLVGAPSGSSAVMSDEIGVIDTLRPYDAGASVTLNSAADHLSTRVKGSVATIFMRDSVALHKILVIGDAGWESKFVVAALEEEGWKVDASIRVAPGVDVAQGSVMVIDTSRYSAVIALDDAATTYANRITEFARTGGGVVLAPQAASLDAMALFRAGAAGRASSEVRGILAGGPVSMATLALAPLTSLRSDAIPLEIRAGSVAVAARRIGAGRLLQLGYEDTWRLRIGGGDGAVHDHQVLWTRLVSRVAYAPRVRRAAITTPADQAPLVGLVAAIGPRASTAGMSTVAGGQPDRTVWLFLLLSLALVGEVASRRMRGGS